MAEKPQAIASILGNAAGAPAVATTAAGGAQARHYDPVRLGEVCVRDANVMHGYVGNLGANSKAFTAGARWFRTGDQGYVDDDGYLFLAGRIKELINRGGEKIPLLELVSVLLQCPGVAEAVSYAVRDGIYSQEVHAAVIPQSGAALTEDDVKRFMADSVAAFKVPKRVYRYIVAKHFARPQ
ncbi:hypothetical protein IWQ57_003198 [Coemansia nantahalensis]|uniref:Uncharacterized protein n=1 Tax=Coemansia nantahalensis TaxID=2789366 RepID=A0ACC1JXC0_9FUNG|nr:hypothetical protein IWQ57_003198 [Coemansia nantahalensis]